MDALIVWDGMELQTMVFDRYWCIGIMMGIISSGTVHVIPLQQYQNYRITVDS